MKTKTFWKKTECKALTVMIQCTYRFGMSPRNETREIKPPKLMNWTIMIILGQVRCQSERLMGNSMNQTHFLPITGLLTGNCVTKTSIQSSQRQGIRHFPTVFASKLKKIKQNGKGNLPNASTPLSVEKIALNDKNCVWLNSP